MSTVLKFDTATVRDVALAKVGNPLMGEELITSDTVCGIKGENEELISEALLKRFKSQERQVFTHVEELSENLVFSVAKSIFSLKEDLVKGANAIATHLYDGTKDPEVKSGDLCIATVDDVTIGGSPCKALCIVKSESSIPVLEISDGEEGLDLKTHNVIAPDKIQKGALIVAYQEKEGFAVYAFDKSAGDAHAWSKEFLGIKPLRDENFMTKRYTDMAVAFAQDELQEEEFDKIERFQLANQAMSYFEENDDFDLQSFEQTAFGEDQEKKAQFQAFRQHYKDDDGTPLEEQFAISKPVAKKASRKVKGVMNLDNGASITFKPQFSENIEESLEKGFDEERQMKFVKIYYNSES